MAFRKNKPGRLPGNHPEHSAFGRLLRPQVNEVPLVDHDAPDRLSFTHPSWWTIVRQFQRGLPSSVDVSTDGPCWCLTFEGSRGYPTIHVKITAAGIDKRIGAHRLMYKLFNPRVELVHGDRSLQVSHRCGRKKCVNPDHLVLESDRDNKQRNYCRHGAAHLCPHVPKCIF